MNNEYNFCGYCGAKLEQDSLGAENYRVYFEGGSYHPYTKFSVKTGKRQIVRIYRCSYWKKGWRSSPHTNHTSEKIVEID